VIIEMGIGWMPDPENPGGLVSANPGDYAREIERLRDTLRKVINHPLTHLSGDVEIQVNQALK
jgi:hypothetical protein